MKLSDGEKLILTMLADIYAALKIDGEIDAEFVKSAVLGGHSWALRWKYSGFNPKDDDPHVVEETGEILSMWRVIQNAIDQMSADEVAQLKIDCHPYDIQFEGFDGNNDPHYSVMHFMVGKLERFDEYGGHAINSHSRASLPHYRGMLNRYDAIMSAFSISKLTADQIKHVIHG